MTLPWKKCENFITYHLIKNALFSQIAVDNSAVEKKYYGSNIFYSFFLRN